MNRRRVLAGAAVTAMGLLLAAASGGARAAAVKDGGTFRTNLVTQSIDPALNGADFEFSRASCGSLMAYPSKPLPAGLRLAPELATSGPKISGGGRTYTFTIRENARFSTGARVTAKSFAHSLERMLTPAMQSQYASFFEDVVGARAMLAGKATTLTGALAQGRTLVLKLVKPVPDLASRLTHVCAVPESLPVDPEGAKAPLPSAGPYFVAQFVPERILVLDRNPYYGGRRPHRVERIISDMSIDSATAVNRVAKGELDAVTTDLAVSRYLPPLVRRYGINRSRFFLQNALAGRMFFLNTSRPLFKNNAPLRRAVNFAVDRKALVREFGPAAAATDQLLPPGMPGYRDERIYPLGGPDLRKGRALAAGHLRAGKAVLYTCTEPDYCVAPAQVLQRSLRAIGLQVEIKRFPLGVYFQKAATPGEPYDMILIGWAPSYNDPGEYLGIFDAHSPNNYSHFVSPAYQRLLDSAARLSGSARYRAYGRLDVQLIRDEAPVIPYAIYKSWAFVSKRTGCVMLNPLLDLAAVCLK